MLFFVAPLSHYCKFKAEHAFPNSHFLDLRSTTAMYCQVRILAVSTLLTLFLLQPLSVNVLMQLLKRKRCTNVHIFSRQKFSKKRPPFP